MSSFSVTFRDIAIFSIPICTLKITKIQLIQINISINTNSITVYYICVNTKKLTFVHVKNIYLLIFFTMLVISIYVQ